MSDSSESSETPQGARPGGLVCGAIGEGGAGAKGRNSREFHREGAVGAIGVTESEDSPPPFQGAK